jgi:hypothetical protein
MGAPVMRRQDPEALDLPATVGPLVFDAEIGELDMIVDDGQAVRVRPLVDLIARPRWPSTRCTRRDSSSMTKTCST